MRPETENQKLQNTAFFERVAWNETLPSSRSSPEHPPFVGPNIHLLFGSGSAVVSTPSSQIRFSTQEAYIGCSLGKSSIFVIIPPCENNAKTLLEIGRVREATELLLHGLR